MNVLSPRFVWFDAVLRDPFGRSYHRYAMAYSSAIIRIERHSLIRTQRFDQLNNEADVV